MARKDPVGLIVLQPEGDAQDRGTIEFISLQDPTAPDPREAKMKATDDDWVSWLVQNNFDKHKISVIITFDWEGAANPPFKKNIFTKNVKDLSTNGGPEYTMIKAKVARGATRGSYKFVISADLNGISRVDPVLEIDDGASVDPGPS